MVMQKNTASAEDLSNPDAWVDIYGDDLFRFAFARVKSKAVAEDLVQETFLAALNARKRFEGRSTARTWFMSILKHKMVDHFRKHIREKSVDDPEAYADGQDAWFNERGHWVMFPSKWASHPAKAHEQREFLDAFYQCLANLPERLATIFMLREVDGAETEDICQEMGISATNSWTMLYRARMGLRKCLEKGWLRPETGGEEK